jgi:hypothetical protein
MKHLKEIGRYTFFPQFVARLLHFVMFLSVSLSYFLSLSLKLSLRSPSLLTHIQVILQLL